MKKSNLIISALALILMSACGDATGIEPDDLAGIWTAQSMVLTNTADATQTVDYMALGASTTLTFAADATYTWIFTDPGLAAETRTGSYSVVGTTLTLSESGTGSPEPFAAVRAGNTLTLTGVDTYDFDSDTVEEAATLTIVLTR